MVAFVIQISETTMQHVSTSTAKVRNECRDSMKMALQNPTLFLLLSRTVVDIRRCICKYANLIAATPYCTNMITAA